MPSAVNEERLPRGVMAKPPIASRVKVPGSGAIEIAPFNAIARFSPVPRAHPASFKDVADWIGRGVNVTATRRGVQRPAAASFHPRQLCEDRRLVRHFLTHRRSLPLRF